MGRKRAAVAYGQQEERDPQEQKNLEGAFAEALEDVQSAQEATETKYWRNQFAKRRKDLSVCAKSVKDFVENHELADLGSIKNLMKQLKGLSVFSDDFNDLVDPIIQLVKDLNEFRHTFKLYAEIFTHEATFDSETGKLAIKQVKA